MKTKLAGHLPLQDAIAKTIEEAREKMKLASEDCDDKSGKSDKVKKLLKFEKKEHGHVPSVEEEKAEYEKKSSIIDPADPEEVEKLAAALDEMAVKIAGDSVELGNESHQGGTVLPTMRPVGGTQPYKKDSSKSHNVPTHTGMISTKDNPGAKTAVPTDDHRAPGGTGAKYPAKGPFKTASVARLQAAVEKVAFSITGEGHKLDADWYGAESKGTHDSRKAGQEYRKKAPIRDTLALGPVGRFGQKLHERHQDYAAKKHEGKKNAYNPFGGWATKSRHEQKEKKSFSLTEEGHKYDAAHYKADAEKAHKKSKGQKDYAAKRPGLSAALTGHHALNIAGTAAKGQNVGTMLEHGGSKGSHIKGALERLKNRHADYAAKKHEKGRNAYNPFGGLLTKSRQEGGKNKKSASEESAVDYILGKIATVYNGGESKQGGEQLSNTAPVPSNAGRELIRNKDGIKNVTKREAKSPRKKELAEVLTEPAMSAAHDSKVNENLRNAAKGGVKIAAAREFLRKIASEGCQCDGAGECRYCQMQEKAAALRGDGTGADAPAA